MTPKISLVVTVVGSALAFAVPVAWGDDSQAGRLGPGNLAISPEVYENTMSSGATAVRLGPGSLAVSPDIPAGADERSAVASSQPAYITSPDAIERAAAFRADYGSNRRFDSRISAPLTSATSVVTPFSDDGLEWPQIGIGFGIGVLLALGLVMVARLKPARPVTR